MASNQNPTKLLLVSKEPSALISFWAAADANSWHVETSASGWEALERAQCESAPDLILLDLAQGDTDGLHTLRWLRRLRPHLPVLVLAHASDAAHKIDALRLGAHDFLINPLNKEQFELAVNHHLFPLDEDGEMETSGKDVEQIDEGRYFVAASPIMHKLRRQAELLAQVHVPVLITGESGSGKETVARLIHKLSVRSGFPFVKIHCGVLPGDLLESELFGSVPQDSVQGKRGKLEACQQGTILLHEIAEMPASLQEKLLHFLQGKEHARLNGESAKNGDVRILASITAPLDQVIAEGKLREDLFYTLSAFTVHVPSLRQRREEVPLLLGHSMKQIGRHYGLPARSFSTRMLESCQFYSWPGNLAEMEDFVKRYLVVGDEDLALNKLKLQVAESESHHAPANVVPISSPEAGNLEEYKASLKSLVRSVKGEAERNAISSALEQTHWNRKAAARLLRVSYRTLLYKIQEYHMTPPEAYPQHYAASNGTKGNGHVR